LADSVQALLLGRFNPGTFCIITFLITMHIMNLVDAAARGVLGAIGMTLGVCGTAEA